MKVCIKKFDVNMEVKANGIELEVRAPDDSHQIGDCYVTMTSLIWCKGRREKKNGTKMLWEQFIEIMKCKETMKAALKAAQKAALKAGKKASLKGPKSV